MVCVYVCIIFARNTVQFNNYLDAYHILCKVANNSDRDFMKLHLVERMRDCFTNFFKFWRREAWIKMIDVCSSLHVNTSVFVLDT